MRITTTVEASGGTTTGLPVPDDLARALDAAGVRESFDALSFSRQRAIVEPVESAKAAETRQRRIEKAVAALS
ncbi:YdeI/OmpD-associated family protein [Cellulosimicrobium sp. E-16]|uniref:YdeI/OmpD-associated family protein n=1 Tax=Cellulosimicrobium sp. E-16 TaxID=3404049 RepID=UPI003CF36297